MPWSEPWERPGWSAWVSFEWSLLRFDVAGVLCRLGLPVGVSVVAWAAEPLHGVEGVVVSVGVVEVSAFAGAAFPVAGVFALAFGPAFGFASQCLPVGWEFFFPLRGSPCHAVAPVRLCPGLVSLFTVAC